MPYIGNKSDTAFTSLEKQDFSNPSGTSLTLTHAVANANDIALYINNVRQEPTEAYSVNGTTVTLTGSVSNSDDIYAVYLARAVQTTVPPDGSVSTAKIANSAVTDAKISAVSASKLTGTVPIANGGTGRTAELHSAWVLSPQISSPSSATGLMEWAKDAESTTDNLNGTDVTMSSGVITFPSTGLYKLTIDMQGRQGSSSVTYVGFTWEHSSDSGSNFSTVWRRLTNSISGGYFAFMSDFYYNVTNISTQRLKALHYATALSGLVIDGGQGYTSTRLYITKVS